MKNQPEPLDSITACFLGNLLRDQLRLEIPQQKGISFSGASVSSSPAEMLTWFSPFFPHNNAVKLPCPLHSLGKRWKASGG